MPIDNRNCFLVNLRDGLRCRACGRGPAERETYHRGFGYHHVIPVSCGGADTAENLVLFCKLCHDAHHAGRQTLDFGPQILPPPTVCQVCREVFDPLTVEMNCGWYRCPYCRQRVHLFDHFCFG